MILLWRIVWEASSADAVIVILGSRCSFRKLVLWSLGTGWMWRSIYLAKLPRLAKKLRVMTDWTLALLFGREIEQMITLRDVQALNDRLARIRAQQSVDQKTSLAIRLSS
jgi:hypothetical protein